MTESLADLTATYGPAEPYSEHHRNDNIRSVSAEGIQRSGTIVWMQAPFGSIPLKYIVARDVPGAWLDFAFPADVIAGISLTHLLQYLSQPGCLSHNCRELFIPGVHIAQSLYVDQSIHQNDDHTSA